MVYTIYDNEHFSQRSFPVRADSQGTSPAPGPGFHSSPGSRGVSGALGRGDVAKGLFPENPGVRSLFSSSESGPAPGGTAAQTLTHLLDTQACVSILRGHPAALARMASHRPSDLGVSMVTGFELYSGVEACRFPAKERARVELFLAPLILVPFDQEAARTAANVRQKLEKQGRRIGPYDLLIAGQAITLDVILVTHNLREFGRVPGLRLETWET